MLNSKVDQLPSIPAQLLAAKDMGAGAAAEAKPDSTVTAATILRSLADGDVRGRLGKPVTAMATSPRRPARLQSRRGERSWPHTEVSCSGPKRPPCAGEWRPGYN
jgi:hypothetical protein